MRLCAIIVAGGRSSRMGRQKALESIRGRSILDRIVMQIGTQVDAIVLNTNGDAGHLGQMGFPIIRDLRAEIGTPLAGVHAALAHATENGFDAVLTLPSDAPFLPGDLVQRLTTAKRPAAIAASGGQSHYLTGLWSCALLQDMEFALDQPRTPRLQDWSRMCDAAIVEWPAQPFDPFFNVNTPEELAEAERIAAEFSL